MPTAVVSLAAVMIAAILGSCDDRSRAPTRQAALGGAEPPVADRIPKVIERHGHTRTDDYYWIRDDSRTDAKVLSHLLAENDYTQRTMAHTSALQAQLYHEITSRLAADDKTVPVRHGDYLYHREYRSGGEYPIYFRRTATRPLAKPEAILDVNELALGHDYYAVAGWAVSSGHDLLAYADDTVGRRQYRLRFKALTSGERLADRIDNTSGAMAWGNDNRTIYYVKRHPVTLLPYRVYRHRLGETGVDDLVYEEHDRSFFTRVFKTRSKKYVVIEASSTLATEAWLIDADDPAAMPVVFHPREDRHEYELHHVGDRFYVKTNWRAANYRLMETAVGSSRAKDQWREVIAHRPKVLLADVEAFEDYLVAKEVERAVPELRVLVTATGESHRVTFDEAAYSLDLLANPDTASEVVRFAYSSLTTPRSVFDYDMRTRTRRLLKQNVVNGDFQSSRYRTKRLHATGRDGTDIPISLVYRAGSWKYGKNPLYLHAYGSYGYSTWPTFQSRRLSLLDRGFVFAIVHVRGGQELGRGWYDEGRLFAKRNTFWDFIDATRHLVRNGYGAPDKVYAMGTSAGGLLMGVVANEAPELYRGIVAHVPFVDVVTTMLDETIPLTTQEYDEWGDPGVERGYRYMLSYSPYDQVGPRNYPHLLVTTGLYDSQVQYFEPVKWVAKVRRETTGNNLVLLDVDMTSGHGGASGRHERHRLDALEYAFILDTLGMKD